VELRPAASLTPYARNARTHSPEQVLQLKGLIAEFGWTNPILVDDQGIVAGHGRQLAALQIYAEGGLIRLPGGAELPAGVVPVIDCTGWSEAQRRAYVLADNKAALNAGWDTELLKIELQDLGEMGFDLSLTAFSVDELATLTADPTAGETEADEVPEAPQEPVTAPGDVWVLGKHRIICGSSTDAHVIAKLLAGEKPRLMVTDPPYGVEYEPDWRNHAEIRGRKVGATATGKVLNDDKADWREAWALFPGDVAYVWHAALHSPTVAESLRACGFELRSQVVWNKPVMVIGRGHYHWKHEACWYVVRKGGTGGWQGDRKQTTVWDIPNMHRNQGDVDDGKTVHGTQKPVECMRRPIENNSLPGDGVYEPFSGSGTTIIACEMTDRRCFAAELDPTYVDVAVERWQRFAGAVARLEETGESFAEVQARRRPAALAEAA
jgi:DNA modification methylase